MSQHIEKIRERQQQISEFARNNLMARISEFEDKSKTDLGPLRASFKEVLPLLILGLVLPTLLKMFPLPKLALQVGGMLSLGLMGFAFFRIGPSLRLLATSVRQAEEKRQSLRTQLKREVSRYLEPSFQFLSQPLFPEWAYKESGIFPQKIDSRKAEDQLRGVLGSTAFQMTEVTTCKKVKSKGANGNVEVRLVPVFRGIILVADFHKRFSSRTTIQSDVLEKKAGDLGKIAQRILGNEGSMKLVELENGLFEKKWKVVSSDPVEARYIITPRFMEQFLALEDFFGEGVQAAFLDGKMVLAIPRSKNFFEIEPRGQTLVADVENAAEELLQILDLLDHFDLNLELWKVREKKGGAA